MKNLQIINRFYSTPIRIHNFKNINTVNYTKKSIKPIINTSYINMYSALKPRIKKYVQPKKD
jgi:hypothetical protein